MKKGISDLQEYMQKLKTSIVALTDQRYKPTRLLFSVILLVFWGE